MYHNILVPYDGSSQSKNAFKAALDIAKSSNANLSLLYVVQEIFLPNYFGRGQAKKTIREYEKEIYTEHKKKAQKVLLEQKKKGEAAGIRISVHTAYGSTPNEILKFAKKNGIDLVVMGTASRRGLARMMAIGSVARKVSEASACPVMLVH